jgi:predicted deacetylase
VTPFHRHRLERAEQLLSDVRATEVLYLLVPDYHGRAPVAEDAAFGAWCRRPRPFQVRWALHGHFHQECPVDAQATTGFAAHLKRRLLTDGEAEFLGLRGADLAIHPYDFDHPRVEACIRRTLTTAIEMRVCGGHADLW